MAKGLTARMCTSEGRHAISRAAAQMGSGGTSSTIIRELRCDSPPDICKLMAAPGDGSRFIILQQME